MNMDSNLDWRSSREPLRDRFFRMSEAKCKVLRRFWRVLEASWEGFWRVLKISWGGFSTYFGIFFNYWFRNGFLYAFEMILDGFWYPLEKQKWAFHMEGIAKIKLSCCLNEVVWGSWGILIFDGLLINFYRFFHKFSFMLIAFPKFSFILVIWILISFSILASLWPTDAFICAIRPSLCSSISWTTRSNTVC